MDLSKAFDTINHDLIITKLNAFLEKLGSYAKLLKNKKQRVQINKKFSFERDTIVGVPQGSIDGLLLFNFNLFINGLIFFIQNSTLSNYADDNNLLLPGEDKELTKSLLYLNFKIAENWFLKTIWFLIREIVILCVSAKMLLIHSYLTSMTKF